MVYEYESKLKNRLLDLEFDTWEETAQFEREYRELERVYRKAKAWDNYEDSVRSLVSKHADENTDIEKEVRDILSVYMEDE